MEEGPFWSVGISTTSLEGAHLFLVDLVAHCRSHRVGNFDDRLWGVSMILVIIANPELKARKRGTTPKNIHRQNRLGANFVLMLIDYVP